MAKQVQYEIDWNQKQQPTESDQQNLEHEQLPTVPTRIKCNEDVQEAEPGDHPDEREKLSMPNPTALPEAVGRAVFGVDELGNVNPGPEEVEEITEHHTERLVELLDRMRDIDERLTRASGDSRNALYREKDQVHSSYQGTLALYAEDFGEKASRHLDAWARHQFASEFVSEVQQVSTPAPPPRYDPGHPWHYYREGDAAKPIDPDAIEPATDCDWSFAVSLPRNVQKRKAQLHAMLEEHRRQLGEDKARYRDLLNRGPDALSEYDREISHGGNLELAWASAVALKYNHIRFALGRIAWLESRVRV